MVASNEILWAIDEIVKRNNNDREIMLEAIKFRPAHIKDIGTELLNDRDFIIEAYLANIML